MESLPPRPTADDVARQLGIEGYDLVGPVRWVCGPDIDYTVRLAADGTYESAGPYRKHTADDPDTRTALLRALLAEDGTDNDRGQS